MNEKTAGAVPKKPAIALIGLMACGKSTVGRSLAARLGLPFIDSDTEVEREAGMDIARIFATEGEAGFRGREKAALARVSTGSPVVLATGGGIVLDKENRAILAASFMTVWLQVRPETAAKRARSGIRPLLAHDDPLETLTTLVALRSPFYASCSRIVVSTDDRNPEEITELIYDEIRRAI